MIEYQDNWEVSSKRQTRLNGLANTLQGAKDDGSYKVCVPFYGIKTENIQEEQHYIPVV